MLQSPTNAGPSAPQAHSPPAYAAPNYPPNYGPHAPPYGPYAPPHGPYPPTYSPPHGGGPYGGPSYPAPPPYYTSPPATYPPSPPPPPPPPPSDPLENPPICTLPNPGQCFGINATAGSALDAYRVSAQGWAAADGLGQPSVDDGAPVALLYEFGVAQAYGNILSYRPRQLYSYDSTAVLVGLPVGAVQLYVCVRAARLGEGNDGMQQSMAGPPACATLLVVVSAEVSEEQVQTALSEITMRTAETTAASGPLTPADLDTVRRLAVLAAVTNANASAADANATASALRSLASDLLVHLVTVPPPLANATVVPITVIQVTDTVATAWSLADSRARAAALSGTANLAEQLSTQPLSPADAAPIVDLISSMMGAEGGQLLVAVADGAGGAPMNASAAARQVLSAATRGAAGISGGLLAGATLNGESVRLVSLVLVVVARRDGTTALAAGVVVEVDTPAAAGAAGRRRQLLATPPSPTSIRLSTAVAELCAADAACASAGVGVTLAAMGSGALLEAALGGSAAPLAAGMPGYAAGSAVQVVSPVVRVAASGLPAAAANGSVVGLVRFELPVYADMLQAGMRRAVVRLQDYDAAPSDPAAGIAPGVSTTYTWATAPAADLVSGSSNMLGDFAVIQYTVNTAIPGAAASPPPPRGAAAPGADTSPAPPPPPGGAAGPGAQPRGLLTGVLAAAAMALMAILA